MSFRKSLLLLLGFVGSLSFLTPASAQELNEVPGHMMIDFGLSFLQGNPDQVDVNPWRSPYWNVSYLYPFRFNEESQWSVNVGLGFSQSVYGFQNDVLPLYDTASINPSFGLIFDTVSNILPANEVTVSQLSGSYINLPVELRWELSPGYTRTNLFVAAGGSIGYRLGAYSRVRYAEGIGGELENKTLIRREAFELNQLRYGAHLRVGINFFNIWGRYEVSPLWTVGDGPAGGAWTVGVSLDLF